MTRVVCATAITAVAILALADPAAAQRGERPRAAVAVSTPMPPVAPTRPAPVRTAPTRVDGLIATVTLADVGFIEGLRFSNLGARHEVFVPLPASSRLTATELVLRFDDVSAHEARRSFEVLINDRSAASIALDGRSMDRTVRVPLARVRGREGFVKLTFVYSGAATPDRCIDLRYVGDSLTLRPETGISIDVGQGELDVATTAALMPREVALVVSDRRLGAVDLATTLTVARALKASGRRVSIFRGFATTLELARRDPPHRCSRGLAVIGSVAEAAGFVQLPSARVASLGAAAEYGAIAAVRSGGTPALLISDTAAVRAAQLYGTPYIGATRGSALATVGAASMPQRPTTRVRFDSIGLAPPTAEVFGRADIPFAIATRRLPAGKRPERLLLEMMIAPDGTGEQAVVSAFVDERLLGSTVAAVGEPTRLDLALPPGLAGADINVRAVVQRRSAQGDCRFEPQGYPAQVLGSSSLVLTDVARHPHDFAELTAFWADGVEVWLPASATERPQVLNLVADALANLSPNRAPISVNLAASGESPSPKASFVVVGNLPPSGAKQRVRFDRGRVAVADRDGHTLLDLAGFDGGAVAQLVSVGDTAGLWLRPIADDGAMPEPRELRLDRGDVAFIDQAGIALALSTERDTLVRIAYPDRVSWLTVAERFRAWIMGALWLLATAIFLLGLQRMLRRRAAARRD